MSEVFKKGKKFKCTFGCSDDELAVNERHLNYALFGPNWKSFIHKLFSWKIDVLVSNSMPLCDEEQHFTGISFSFLAQIVEIGSRLF